MWGPPPPHSSFDLVRLLDIVAWPADDSTSTSVSALSTQPDRVTLIKQTFIRLATDLRLCRWLGSLEELQNPRASWSTRTGSQREAQCSQQIDASGRINANTSNDGVSDEARAILVSILKQSSLFSGHGHVDYEMNRELSSGLTACARQRTLSCWKCS